MREVKEKSPLKERAAETFKSAPQAALHRGTDASFQQLRQELHEAAQDGQPEDRYESGKITDTADHAVRRVSHLAEKAAHKLPKTKSEPQKKSIFMRIYEGIESGLEWVVTIPMRVHDKISELMARILDFFANLAENMNKVIKKRDMILQKITGVRSLLEKPYTKKVLKDGKVLLKKMWKHVRPRKLQGSIHFGLEDPATTGQLLGVVGMLYPVYRNHFVIAPDFEQQIFEGKIYAKGRVQIGRMTFLSLRFMLTRDFFKTVQKARTIIGGN